MFQTCRFDKTEAYSHREDTTQVFVLQHAYERPDGSEQVKFVGVYTTEEFGSAAIERLIHVPGFSAMPEGFSIDRCCLDQTNWSEGFVSE